MYSSRPIRWHVFMYAAISVSIHTYRDLCYACSSFWICFRYYFPRHQTCDDGERRGSESSGRSSSHGSVDQVLSPNQPKNPFSNMQPLNVPPRMPPPSSMYPNLPPSAMQMQAGMYAPFRMNNASNPQQGQGGFVTFRFWELKV